MGSKFISIPALALFLLLTFEPSDVFGQAASRRILVFGDSLSAGFGLGKEFAFPALLQERLDQEGHAFTVVNGGVSGDTSAGGLRRLGWMLKKPIDVLILELGANDGLRGISLEETHKNLQAIIDGTRAKFADVTIVIAGMKLPPNLGREYTTQFENLYRQLAKDNELPLIPFLLEGVGGNPELNLEDGIHPNRKGHQIVADTVWRHLKPLLVQEKLP